MTLSINEIKSGSTVLINSQVYIVVECQHVKPGKGAAFVRLKLRSLKDGKTIERTFKGDEKIDEAFVDEKKLQYLYRSDKIYHFMDQENFEQIAITEDTIGNNSKFLKDNLQISAYSYKGEILNIELPTFIKFKITHTEPGLRGDTAKAAMKLATIETNATIQVPLFIELGDTVKIDTRSGEYVERA